MNQGANIPTLTDVQATQARIRDYVRRTPLISARPVRQPPGTAEQLLLQLEQLQVTGSLEARGAVNKLLRRPPTRVARHRHRLGRQPRPGRGMRRYRPP